MPYIVLIHFLLFTSLLTAQAADIPDELVGMSLEDLMLLEVDTATKTAEKYTLAPAVISVITAEDIAAFGYNTVAEALSHVAGFIETNDHVMHNFGVRGVHAGLRAGSRLIKFMINGQPISFRTTQQHFIDEELIPIDLIERIEIVRGPVSALYGANAFTGVVNIITRDGGDLVSKGNQIKLRSEYVEKGGHGGQVAATGGHINNDWDFIVGLNHSYHDRSGLSLPRYSPTYDLFAKGESGRLLSPTTNASHPFSFYLKSDYQPVETRQLGIAAHYQIIDSEHVFSDLNPLRDTGNSRTALENSFIRFNWKESLSTTLDNRFFASYSRGKPLSQDKIEVGAAAYYLERNIGYLAYDIGNEWMWTPSETNTFLFGLDYNREHHDLEHFEQIDRYSYMASSLNHALEKDFNNLGIYAQWHYHLAKKWLNTRWQTTLGFRYDNHSYTGEQNSLRLGLVGELPNDMVIKLLLGNSFQAPSPELLFREAVQGGDIIGNPDLEAQRAETIEASLFVPVTQYLHLTGTAFVTSIKDLVLYQAKSSNVIARNVTDSLTRGLELELRYKKEDFNAYINASWQNTEIDDNPYNLFVLNEREDGSFFPNFSSNFGLSYYWKKPQLTVSLDNRYVGKRPASTQNILLAQQIYELSDYWDTTLSLSTQAFSFFKGKSATLRFQIHDLWDSNYLNTGFGGIEIPSLGRHYTLTFEQRF